VNIGYVPQSVYLMDDTIAANIAFGRDTAADEKRIRRAAQAAAIDGFILGLPEGYQTRVGERGVRLSGGQAQRIAIARALYDDPQVLVLDEPTSALDTVTEKSVLDAIAEAGRRRTVLIVTHREATIEKCPNVIRIANGKVVSGPKYQLQERQLQP
ncbi:MAG: ATP-binding cassette domain-containing protein, partial [Alphaproteobacteria bacterium]|nr:ATP-binding cassette domain-containing protein [Alphaproteobacteria bacterium]